MSMFMLQRVHLRKRSSWHAVAEDVPYVQLVRVTEELCWTRLVRASS